MARRGRNTLLALVAFVSPFAAGAQSLLIENATLIDGTGRTARPGMSVLVERGRIERIERGGIDAPSSVKRLDASRGFLIPGLVDMHVHLRGGLGISSTGFTEAVNDRAQGSRALHGYLYCGVTTIYDSGNDPDFIFGLRADERAGRIVSPRIFATGGIVTYPGSHGSFAGATLVDDWPRALVHDREGRGVRSRGTPVPHCDRDRVRRVRCRPRRARSHCREYRPSTCRRPIRAEFLCGGSGDRPVWLRTERQRWLPGLPEFACRGSATR